MSVKKKMRYGLVCLYRVCSWCGGDIEEQNGRSECYKCNVGYYLGKLKWRRVYKEKSSMWMGNVVNFPGMCWCNIPEGSMVVE